MDKKVSSKTVHSESCERDPLFEDAARLVHDKKLKN